MPPIHLWESAIFPRLTPKEFTLLGQTCKYLRAKVNNSQEIWKAFYLYYNSGMHPTGVIDWKARVIRQELIKRNLRMKNVVEKIFTPPTPFAMPPIFCGGSLYATLRKSDEDPRSFLVRYIDSTKKPEVIGNYTNLGYQHLRQINNDLCVSTTSQFVDNICQLTLWDRDKSVFTIAYTHDFYIYGDLIFITREECIEVRNFKTNVFVEMIPVGVKDVEILGVHETVLILKNDREHDVQVLVHDYRRQTTKVIEFQTHNPTHGVTLDYPVLTFHCRLKHEDVHYSCITGLPIENCSFYHDETCDYFIINNELFRRCLITREVLNRIEVPVPSSISWVREELLCLIKDKKISILNKKSFEIIDTITFENFGCYRVFDGLYACHTVNQKNNVFEFYDVRTKVKYPPVNIVGHDQKKSPFGYFLYPDVMKESATLVSLLEPLPVIEPKARWYHYLNPYSYFRGGASV